MQKAPYTPSPNNVKRFFEKIKELGVPTKVNIEYLKTIGFKSGNDHYLITVSKTLGFIDAVHKPTDKWIAFKDKRKASKVMADAIKTTYDALFETYPDADKKDEQALLDYFAAKCLVATSVSKYMAQTFKYLCEFADFEAVSVTEPATPTTSATPKIKDVVQMTTGTRPITININIQLQLPATEDVKIYDSLFNALKKNLFS